MDNSIRAREMAAQPYSVVVVRDIDTTGAVPLYVAYHPELVGCMAQGYTPDEAKASLNDARIDYIEHFLDHGLDVPGPADWRVSEGFYRSEVNLEDFWVDSAR